MTPLLYGLVAAVGWGCADYLAALSARRLGTFLTMLGMQVSSLVLFSLGLALFGAFPAFDAAALVTALGLGVVGALSLAALYRGLAYGPVAIVAPVAAANAAVTILLAVALLGERLGALQSIAIAATIAGVVLASTDLRVVRETLGRPTRGVALAVIALVGFGVLGLLIAVVSRERDPFTMVVLLRAGTTALLLCFGVARSAIHRLAPRALAAVVAIGLLDTGGNAAYGLGAVSGYASIVSTGSSAYLLIPLALGLAVLKERVAPNQLVGVALLLAGLVTLGLAT